MISNWIQQQKKNIISNDQNEMDEIKSEKCKICANDGEKIYIYIYNKSFYKKRNKGWCGPKITQIECVTTRSRDLKKKIFYWRLEIN